MGVLTCCEGEWD